MQTLTYESLSEFTPITRTEGAPIGGRSERSALDLTPTPVLKKARGVQTSPVFQRLKPKNEILFAPRIDGRLKIYTPFRVRLTSSVKGVSARVEEIEEFGFGGNRGEALDDLAKTIPELYFSLQSDRERLSDDLRRVLSVLERHLIRVHD